MNTFTNSQTGERTKFLDIGLPASQPRVRLARYIGQEDDAERRARWPTSESPAPAFAIEGGR